MAKDNKQKGWIALIAGAIILMFVWNSSADGRSARPIFDDDINMFDLSINSIDSKAEVGDIFSIDIKIRNPEDEKGMMWVQCSILDEAEHSWLEDVQLQSVSFIPGSDNCVANEPFTQTARVALDGRVSQNAKFTVSVPNKVGKENIYVYCAAFEQCYVEEPLQDPYISSSIKRSVDIVQDDADDSNNNYASSGETCDTKTDCPGWLISDVDCVNGYCVDVEDMPDEPDGLNIEWPSLTDSDIKRWAQDYEVMLWLGGMILLIIGATIVYRKPKRPEISRYR